MKIIILILITAVLMMGIGLKFAYDEISTLNQSIVMLKNSNVKLKRKNKKLQNKQKAIKKKIVQRRKRIINRNFRRAEKQIAKAPLKMVPWVGIPVIIAMTSFEVKEYCEDIKEIKCFENDLFGIDQNVTSDKEKKICGMDVEAELKPMAEQQYKESKKWIIDSTSDLYNNTIHTIDDAKKRFEEIFSG